MTAARASVDADERDKIDYLHEFYYADALAPTERGITSGIVIV